MNKRGSALLVSLLIMGILISISLALSTLILRETRVTINLLDSGAAYYAAESGIELSLLGLDKELPGWQPTDSSKEMAVAQVGEKAVVEYQVENRCSAFPCIPDGVDISNYSDDLNVDPALAGTFYQALDVNETVTIPLFVVSGGEIIDVEGFTVEFWSSLDPSIDLKFAANQAISSWDVLRWKILGIEKGGEEQPESIGDFTALSGGTDAVGPSWFGSVNCSEADHTQRYLKGIKCGTYVKDAEYTTDRETGNQVITGFCWNTEAREYYEYNGSGKNRKVDYSGILNCYEIKNFLNDHYLNYLTLTNFFNPDVLKSSLETDQKEQKSKIYVRVELFGTAPKNQTVREVANIKAHGYSGDSKRSIEVQVKRGGFMPVFNFSLYSTYKEEDHGVDYFYGPQSE